MYRYLYFQIKPHFPNFLKIVFQNITFLPIPCALMIMLISFTLTAKITSLMKSGVRL